MAKTTQTTATSATVTKVIEGPPVPTDLEMVIAKFEARLAEKKHIDGRDVALNYIFPLLRKLAAASGDQEEQISDLAEDVAELAESGVGSDADTIIDAFEAAKDMLAKIGGLLDATMVAAGFYNVSKTGLLATDKVPTEIRAAYEGLGGEAHQVVTDIQEAIALVESGADDEDDDDGDDGDPAIDGVPEVQVTESTTETPTTETPATASSSTGATNAA